MNFRVWIFNAGFFPARCARAHLFGSADPVDYAPIDAVDYDAAHLWITLAELAVDYDAAHLWISQPFGLGRIYPLAELAVD